MIEKGDIISLVVDGAWANAVALRELLGSPAEDLIGSESQFLVLVAEVDEYRGLWIEKPKISLRQRKRIAPKWLVPWPYILTIGTHPLFEADHPKPKKPGFK